MSATGLRPLTYTDSLNFLLPLRSVGKEKGKGKEREIIDLDEAPRPRSEGSGGHGGQQGYTPAPALVMALNELAERNAGSSSRTNQVNQPGESGGEVANTTDEGNERGPSRSAGDDPK